MKELFLVIVTGAAVICDLWKGKIPNFLIAAGMGTACWFQFTEFGIPGFWSFLGGSIASAAFAGGVVLLSHAWGRRY